MSNKISDERDVEIIKDKAQDIINEKENGLFKLLYLGVLMFSLGIMFIISKILLLFSIETHFFTKRKRKTVREIKRNTKMHLFIILLLAIVTALGICFGILYTLYKILGMS